MTEIVQIILGTNGSGKSSLVEELTPLPADRGKYIKDGYKIIIVKHHGDTYRLESHFPNNKQEHYLIKNEAEDLNPGRTLTVQKELVKTIFGITPELHELAYGAESFTSMAPLRRREWFTILNEADYSYSIKLYKKASEAMRDTIGGLNILKKRYTQEIAKRIDEETIRQIQKRLTALTLESQKLYSLKNVEVGTSIEVGKQVEQQSKIIHELDRTFRTLRKEFISQNSNTYSDIGETIQCLEQQFLQAQGHYTQLSQNHVDLLDKLKSVECAQGLSIPTLIREINVLKKECEEVKERCYRNIQYSDWKRTKSALDDCYEVLVNVFTHLPPDENKVIHRENYEACLKKLDVAKYNITQLENQLDKIHHKLEHYDSLKASGNVVCPSCQFSWIRDFDQVDYDNQLQLKEKIVQTLENIHKESAQLQTQLQGIVEYQKLLDPYNQIARHNNAMQDICVYLAENDLVKLQPRKILTVLEIEKNNLNELSSNEKRENIIEEKIQSLQIAQRSRDSNIELIKEQLQKNEENLGNLVHEKSEIKIQLDQAIAYRDRLNMFDTLASKLENHRQKLENTMGQFVDAMRNELIDKMLVDTHSSIAQLRSSLNEIETKDALIADMEQQIASLELDQKGYREIARALSPVDGLIADGMLGFIRRYVHSMNSLIAKVWSYRLEVKDCSLDENTAELNYKFPLYVANNDEPTADVSKSSSGQQGIINLAFKIVAMFSAGLHGYPLPLDEFGKEFDKEHRGASVRVILDLIEQLGFQQIFMISHYEDCWGAFNGAEVCVMDRRNITLPKGLVYNEHVTFTV